jgi:hypothetical protein
MLIGQVLDDQPPDHIGHSSPTPRPAGRAGVVGVYRDIRFVLSHADGFLPHAFERMALTIARDGGLSPAEVVEQFRTFYFDTALSAGTAALPTVLAFARPGHQVFGTDWPFAPQPVVDHFTAGLDQYAGIDEAVRRAVDRDNAVALFSWRRRSRPGGPGARLPGAGRPRRLGRLPTGPPPAADVDAPARRRTRLTVPRSPSAPRRSGPGRAGSQTNAAGVLTSRSVLRPLHSGPRALHAAAWSGQCRKRRLPRLRR